MPGNDGNGAGRDGAGVLDRPRGFEPIFDKRYPELFGTIEGGSETEAGEIVGLLSASPGAVIADIGCGRGRHAVPLARRGFRVVGVDYSEKMLSMGRARARKEGVDVEWVREDMRTFRRPEALDFALSLFSSFGFFSDEENQSVLDNIGASLKRGGALLLDLRNSAKEFARPGDSERLLQVPAGLLRMTVRYDRILGRARAEHILTRRDGIRISSIFDVRVYNRRELGVMLRIAGMRVREVFGSLSGALLTRNSDRMVVVADKA